MVDAWEKDLAKVLKAQGGKSIVSRVMFVVYPSNALNQRKASVAVTSHNSFANGGPKSSSDGSVLQDFAQHGRHILGTDIDYYNRMSREIVFSFVNSMTLLGLEGITINDLLTKLKFRSGNPAEPDKLIACSPMHDYNQTTEHGRRTYDEGLKHFVWMNYVTEKYYMNIGKAQHHKRLVNIAQCEASTSLGHLNLDVPRPVDFSRPIRLRRHSLDMTSSPAGIVVSLMVRGITSNTGLLFCRPISVPHLCTFTRCELHHPLSVSARVMRMTQMIRTVQIQICPTNVTG